MHSEGSWVLGMELSHQDWQQELLPAKPHLMGL